jgi:two-component system, NtrC family, sensor kinase
MNAFAFSGLLTGLTSMAFGYFVYVKGRHRSVNRLWFFFTLTVGVWGWGGMWIGLASTPTEALWAWRLVFASGVVWIPILFAHFVYVFCEIPASRFLIASYLHGAVFVPLAFTDVFFSGVRHVFSSFYYSVPGAVFPYFVIWWLGTVIYSHWVLFATGSHRTGQKKTQISYFLLATSIGYLFGALDYLPIFGIDLYPYGNFAIVLYPIIMTYAIVRHRLMDISLVINKGLGYAIVLGIIVVATSIGAVLSNRATAHSIPPLLTGTLFLICGLWVLGNSMRTAANVTFAALCGAACLWLFGCFMLFSAKDGHEALFWERVIYTGVVYIPVLAYHFAQSLLGAGGKDRLLVWGYLLSTGFWLLSFTNFLVDGYYTYYWGRYPKAGMLHPIFVLYLMAGAFISLYRLYHGYRASLGSAATVSAQLKYTFIALLLGFSASVDFLQTYGAGLYPLGYLFAGLCVTIVAYTMAKYELMDVSLIPSRPKVVLSIKLLALIPAYLVILVIIRMFTGTLHYLLAGVLFALFVVIAGVLSNLQQGVERAIGQTLFRERYDAYDTLVQFSKSLVSILELKSLTKEIVQTLARVMNIKSASVFVLDKEQGIYGLAAHYGATAKNRSMVAIHVDSELARELMKAETALVQEEVAYDAHEAASMRVLDSLRMLDAEVCIPLLNKDRLVGFCNLGQRTNQGMYSNEELSLLRTLAQHAAIAIDNALLYEDLRRSQLLMRRTDRLRSLETMAGGFAHEIRNPLTSIKTFIQLAPERRDDAEFMEQFSQVVCDDVERIERLIHEILDYARYMTPKLTVENLNDIVASCLYFIEVKASSKAIAIHRDLEAEVPNVKLDRQQIKQVLLNLLINAMEAIGDRGGHLSVRTKKRIKQADEAWVQIEVEDSGPGILPKDLEHIFDPFYTTKHSSGEREGTGLGLTIAHQIIQEHGGYIEVSSEMDRGTTFFVNLPVNPPIAGPHIQLGEEDRESIGTLVARVPFGPDGNYGAMPPSVPASPKDAV